MLDFQKYSIKEKKKKNKAIRIIKNNNHHTKTIYAICFKK